MPPTPRPDFVRAAAAGLLGGLAASAVMTGFQAAWADATGKANEGESTTVKAADAIAEPLTGTKVPKPYREAAGSAVHYATGAALGIGYALAAEAEWPVTAGFGVVFGTATAAILDEGVVPALGLAPSPADTPPATHAYSLASHLVFAVALEAVRRGLRG